MMKPAGIRGLAFAALLALACSGCETRAVRIQRNPAVLADAAPATVERIRRGRIAEGDTRGMVEVALGRPARILQRPDGSTEWVYHEPRRNENDYILAGFRHRVEFDPVARGDEVIVEPVDPRLFPNLRTHTTHVILRGGRVEAIRRLED